MVFYWWIQLVKRKKEIENTKKDIDDDKINNIVEQIKNSYVEESEGLSVTSRFDILGKKIIEIVNKISSEYYPESKYPIYELTIEELILFMHYLSTELADILINHYLHHLKNKYSTNF